MNGTVNFEYDFEHDVIIARPRWTLESAQDVMRWYQLHADYFLGRFHARKDMITVNDAFDVAPKIATLWGLYRAKLHESCVSFSVRVRSNPRVRLTTNTSGVRYSISTLEAPTIDDALSLILALRESREFAHPPSSARPSQASLGAGPRALESRKT